MPPRSGAESLEPYRAAAADADASVLAITFHHDAVERAAVIGGDAIHPLAPDRITM